MTEDTNKVFKEYSLDVNGMNAQIKIYFKPDEFVPIYEVDFEGVTDATRLLLMSFRANLVSIVPIDPSRIDDREYIRELNIRYVRASELLVDKNMPDIDPKTKRFLISYIVNMMLGLGELEVLIADGDLEEIAVNGSKSEVWVFHKKVGWAKTNIKPQSENMIYDQAQQIGRKVGRELNNLSPLMDAELTDGSRVNATLFPISQVGNTITIRKFEKNPWTMPALIKAKSTTSDVAALIWMCIENEISLLVSGGTASGKTSFLNAISIFFPASRRIISIEETRELTLPKFYQWVPMLTRQPNPEGKGAIDLYQLMINALRQRPDIVIVGEVRTKEDAETLFEAIHTGHSVYATLHADNVKDTIVRMTNPPINSPKVMMNALGCIVSLIRHRTKNIRRVLEFGEILDSGDANVLYKWDYLHDTIIKDKEMTKLADTLMLYAGVTKEEINKVLEDHKIILDWMTNKNIVNVDDAGFVVAQYYKNKEKVVNMAKSNIDFDYKNF